MNFSDSEFGNTFILPPMHASLSIKRKQRRFISQTQVAYVALTLLALCWKGPEIVAGDVDARASYYQGGVSA